jgi:asparagine synthase (glutamine-hydrolysing)
VEPVCEADYAGLARGVRPPMSALGRLYDRDMAERATALGADAIVTGQGGDAAFFQMPTAHLLADALRLGGPRALFSGVWGDTARWTGRPAWRVLADLWRRAAPMEPPPLLPGLDPEVGLSVHPWVEEAAQAPPAKRLQVAALAGAQVYPGDSSRRRAAEVLRPLLSQPVLEHVLAIPAPQLAEGGRDRALTRQAFAGRLPAEIVARRAKGGLGAYYGQVVVASLHWLRPYLLDGVLCDSGLLDRARLEAGLGPAQLIWEGSSVDILAAALMETWVRYWQARIPDSAASPRPRLE